MIQPICSGTNGVSFRCHRCWVAAEGTARQYRHRRFRCKQQDVYYASFFFDQAAKRW